MSAPEDVHLAEASRCSRVLDCYVFSLFSQRPPCSLIFTSPMQSEAMLNPSCIHTVHLQPWQPMTDKMAELFLERTVCAEVTQCTPTPRQHVWWEDVILFRCSSSSLTGLHFIRHYIPQTWRGSLVSSGIKNQPPFLLSDRHYVAVTQHVGIKSGGVTCFWCHRIPLSLTAPQSYMTTALLKCFFLLVMKMNEGF